MKKLNNSTKVKCRHCKGTGYIQKRRSGYKKGRRLEYKVISYLKSKGWVTHRSYASKGIFDVTATKDGVTLGIQVKNIKEGDYLKPSERQRLEGYHGNTTDYELNEWDMQKHSVRTINIGPIHKIFHVFREKGKLKVTWREFRGADGWVEVNIR